MNPSVWRVGARAAAAAALIALATACSSGTTPVAPSATTAAAGHEAFTKCLTDNGVPAPPEHGPGPDGPGQGGQPPSGPPPSGAPAPGGKTPPAPQNVDQETWDKAMQACASLAPPPPGAS